MYPSSSSRLFRLIDRPGDAGDGEADGSGSAAGGREDAASAPALGESAARSWTPGDCSISARVPLADGETAAASSSISVDGA